MTTTLTKVAKQALMAILVFFLTYSLYYVICLICRYFIYGLPDGFWYYHVSIATNIVILGLGLYGLIYDERPILQLFITLASLNSIWLSIYGTYAAVDYEKQSLAKLADKMHLYSWTHNSSELSLERFMLTLTWDTTQSNNKCCGYKSPFDWNNFRPAGVPGNVYPDSCCYRNSYWSFLGIFGRSVRDKRSDCDSSDEDFSINGCNIMHSTFDFFVIISSAVLNLLTASGAWMLMKVPKEEEEEEEQQLSRKMTDSYIDIRPST